LSGARGERPVKFFFPFSSLASTICAVISRSDEVPIASRKFEIVKISWFLDHGGKEQPLFLFQRSMYKPNL